MVPPPVPDAVVHQVEPQHDGPLLHRAPHPDQREDGCPSELHLGEISHDGDEPVSHRLIVSILVGGGRRDQALIVAVGVVVRGVLPAQAVVGDLKCTKRKYFSL